MWNGKVSSGRDLRRLAKMAMEFEAKGKFFHVINRIPHRFEKTNEYKYLLMLSEFFSLQSKDSANMLPCHFKMWEFRKSTACKKYMRRVLLYCSLLCLVRMPTSEVVKAELGLIRKKVRVIARLLPKKLRSKALRYARATAS